MRVRSRLFDFIPFFIESSRVCVSYCSACATLRELNVSVAQQPVNDAINN
jgi:hypothetical protein